MREQDFHTLSGWVDYDRGSLGSLTKSQELRYFSRRVKRTVLLPLHRMCRDDKRGWKRESPLLCFGTCLCCAIEALGKFHTGKTKRGNSASNFKAFVRAYMDPGWRANRFSGKPLVDHLYDSFRCGLTHGFTIKQGGFERHGSTFQVKVVGNVQQLELDPDLLFRDFEAGFGRFLAHLSAVNKADPAYKRFRKAFQDVFVLGK